MKSANDKKIKLVIFTIGIMIILALILLIVLLNNIKFDSPQNTNITNEISTESNKDYEYPNFDTNNIIVSYDDTGDREYEIYYMDPQGFISVGLIDGKPYVTKQNINKEYDKYFPNSILEDGKKYEIQGINEKIINVHIGKIGNESVSPTILILTESGKLQLVDTEKGINQGVFEVIEDKLNLEDIVRIENVYRIVNDQQQMSIIAIKKDGTTYDLSDII